MAIVQNWKIRSRSHTCAHSGKPFNEGDPFYACIFDDPESEGYVRLDYCPESWDEVHPGMNPPPFSFWRSVYELPQGQDPSEAPVMEKEDAESLLRRMIDEDDPSMDKARYILVVMLERQKLFKQVGEKRTEDDRRLLIYEHRKTGEALIILDPQILLSEVEKVQQEVIELLDRYGISADGTTQNAPDQPEHPAES